MKIEPGDLCRVLPGGGHYQAQGWCTCLDGRFVIVATRVPHRLVADKFAWQFEHSLPCRTGAAKIVECSETLLQPIRPTPESIAWEREHEMPSEARKTELGRARWIVEKA